MANVKPIVIKQNGHKTELSELDNLVIPLITAHPVSFPPTGFMFIYALSSDNNFYQMNSLGVTTNLASGGGSSGLTFQETLRINTILNNI